MIREFISYLKTASANIINFMFSIKLLIFIKFLFGLYQEFKTNKIVVQLAIIYCICVNTFIPVYLLLTNPFNIDYVNGFCENYVFVLFSIYMKDEYLHDYIDQIRNVDVKLGLKSIKVETLILRILSLFIYFILYIFIYRNFNNTSLSQFCGIFITVTQFLAFIPTITMLELFRSRVSLLRHSIEFTFAHDTNFQEGTVAYKLKTIKKYIYIYKHLLDNIQKRFNFIKFVVLVKLSICFERFMVSAHINLATIADEKEVGLIIGRAIYVLSYVVLTFVPPLLAEVAANEVDKIKTILADYLLTCRDAALREGLEDALTYLRVRHFRCVVWRAIPVGISTLLAFVALCTNYLIVLMQFMKS